MQATEETLAGVAKEVLETMAFALVMPTEEEPPGGPSVLRASVGFEGPFRGSVSLRVPDAIVPELVANMLGSDDASPPSRQQQCDAVGELANVMCGNLVQTLAGPEPVFRLRVPEVVAEPDVAAAEAPAGCVTFARVPLENGWAELSLVVNEDPT